MNTHGLLEDDIEALAGDRQAIADRLLREIEASPKRLSDAIEASHALGEAPGPCYRLPNQHEVLSARRRIAYDIAKKVDHG